MAWHRIGDKPLSEPMLICFTDPYICVTRPQQDNKAWSTFLFVSDEHAKPVQMKGLPAGAIPPIEDISISQVNRMLYSSSNYSSGTSWYLITKSSQICIVAVTINDILYSSILLYPVISQNIVDVSMNRFIVPILPPAKRNFFFHFPVVWYVFFIFVFQ